MLSSNVMNKKGCLVSDSRRYFSSSLSDRMTSCAASSPEAEMAKFELTAASAETAAAAAEATAPWEPTWWPQDQILDLIINIHDASGLNYAFTIGALTLAFRAAMLPLFVKAQQNSSRLAHMRPEMDIIQEKMKSLDPKDLEGQQHLAKQVQALFKKYDCNPLKSLIILPIQMPVFMGTFFALKQFPDIFPEKLVDSGILWFTDLSVPDPYGILPISSALSFLLMMELGKKQMMATNPAQGKAMLNFFRGIAVIMIPATWNFPSVIFCYWTANNAFSMVQSAAFNSASIRKMLGIWDPPKPVPGAPPPKGIMELFDDMMKKRKEDSAKSSIQDRIKMHNASIDKLNADKMKEDSSTGRKRRKNRGKM
jgi:YidC/Oxa1 family membrane protein insertase